MNESLTCIITINKMSELDLIIDLYQSTSRQGPGSVAETLKALELINLPKTDILKIADLGCGSGGQTFTLAKNTNSDIIAVDLFSDFLKVLNQESAKLGLQNQIKTLQASIDDLPFEKETFDVIWSEGAIYNIGFENGIKAWKDYLKVGGYLAVSEITWITNNRPKEIEDFWTTAYPEIDTASNKIKILEANGYSLTGYFYLNKESWLENYYQRLQDTFPNFLERQQYSELAKKVVQDNQSEIDLYKQYQNYYSYGFYIAKKNS